MNTEYCIHFDSEAEALAHLRSMNTLDVHNYAIVEGPEDGQFSVVDAETAKEFAPWINI